MSYLMNMKKIAIIIVICLASSASYAAENNNFGAITSSVFQDTEDFKTQEGRRFRIKRKKIEVPKSYGELFQIQVVQNNLVMWYQDKQGILRNVFIKNGGGIPLVITRFQHQGISGNVKK